MVPADDRVDPDFLAAARFFRIGDGARFSIVALRTVDDASLDDVRVAPRGALDVFFFDFFLAAFFRTPSLVGDGLCERN